MPHSRREVHVLSWLSFLLVLLTCTHATANTSSLFYSTCRCIAYSCIKEYEGSAADANRVIQLAPHVSGDHCVTGLLEDSCEFQAQMFSNDSLLSCAHTDNGWILPQGICSVQSQAICRSGKQGVPKHRRLSP